MKISLKKQTGIALGYFFIVTLIGLLLRWLFVTSIPFLNFKNLLHAHSHAALLGWVYIALSVLIYKLFAEKTNQPKWYLRIFIMANISIIGMLISFPVQGYALYSISFSILYLITSYFFTWYILKYTVAELKTTYSWLLIRVALFYLVLSSLGTWAVGPIAATAGITSFWFNDALYFFLHFLYNGFFFLTLISILFYLLEQKGMTFSKKHFDRFYNCLNTGIVLSYFLSVLWTKPPAIFYFLGGIGAVYQLYGYVLLYKMIKPHFSFLREVTGHYSFGILKTVTCLIGLKITLQLLSVIPYLASIAFRLRDFVIGYLHLVFLGMIIPSILIFLKYFKLIRLSQKALNLFLLAVLLTEIMIFYRGFAFWLKLPFTDPLTYNYLLAGVSILFPLSVAGLLWHHLKK